MPATSDLTSAVDRQILIQLGARLKQARLERGMTTTQMAAQAGISRMTLSAVEAGEPTPTMGSYLRVMGVLDVSRDLVLVATKQASRAPLQTAAEAPAKVSAGHAKHELQDLQSLVLHQEAVQRMRKQPELIEQALATLDQWRRAGPSHASFLWDEWAVILHRRAWRRALSHSRRSRELRQASPLPSILPPDVRERILADVRQMSASPGATADGT